MFSRRFTGSARRGRRRTPATSAASAFRPSRFSRRPSNILGLNFELYGGDGSVIAVIGQKMLSIHDKYCIDIYKTEHEDKAVAILAPSST